MQVIDLKQNRVLTLGNPSKAWFRYLEALRTVPEISEQVWKRAQKLAGILVGQKYAHLSLEQAVLELLAEEAVKPVQVNTLVFAPLIARVRPPQRIASSPKYRLKRRSGHQAREPPCTAV